MSSEKFPASHYIGFRAGEGSPKILLLRKQFQIPEKPEGYWYNPPGFLYVSSTGSYELYVNGENSGARVNVSLPLFLRETILAVVFFETESGLAGDVRGGDAGTNVSFDIRHD